MRHYISRIITANYSDVTCEQNQNSTFMRTEAGAAINPRACEFVKPGFL